MVHSIYLSHPQKSVASKSSFAHIMSIRPKTTISFQSEAASTSESETQLEEEAEYDSEKERDETLYFVSGEELSELYSTPDPTQEERQRPLEFHISDSDFASGTFNVQQSIGAIFSDSLYQHPSAWWWRKAMVPGQQNLILQ